MDWVWTLDALITCDWKPSVVKLLQLITDVIIAANDVDEEFLDVFPVLEVYAPDDLDSSWLVRKTDGNDERSGG